MTNANGIAPNCQLNENQCRDPKQGGNVLFPEACGRPRTRSMTKSEYASRPSFSHPAAGKSLKKRVIAAESREIAALSNCFRNTSSNLRRAFESVSTGGRWESAVGYRVRADHEPCLIGNKDLHVRRWIPQKGPILFLPAPTLLLNNVSWPTPNLELQLRLAMQTTMPNKLSDSTRRRRHSIIAP